MLDKDKVVAAVTEMFDVAATEGDIEVIDISITTEGLNVMYWKGELMFANMMLFDLRGEK